MTHRLALGKNGGRGVGRVLRFALVFYWALGAVVMLALPAQAHKRNFAWSYEWFTPLPGEKEIEVWLTSEDKGKNWEPWLEYEFAVSPRYGVGLYLTYEGTFPRDLNLNGWKWENRYRLGNFAPNRWLHAGYLELKKEEDEPYEIEAKWLLSRYSKKDEVLAFNLIAEKPLTSKAEVEWEYTLGWNRPVSKNLRLGLESFGEFEDKEHFLGPNLTCDFSPNFRLIFNAGMGLTGESDDLVLRVLTEYEWF